MALEWRTQVSITPRRTLGLALASALPDMNAGRWYPTVTVLANGDVLVVSGDIDTSTGVNTLPQVFQVRERDVA